MTADLKPPTEPPWPPASRLHELLRTRQLSPVTLVQACLDRIERVDPSIHSVMTVAADEALREAERAESAIGCGNMRGPLHGIPVLLKDDIWAAGMRCTAGSLLLEDFVPDQDSVVAERLRAAGAIILGKTNVPEFSSFYRTVNRLMPECRNPWDLTRTAGGSSGGPAAALAAGIVPLAIGTDGGGSIRLPAALCGVVGLLPTNGLVPNYGSFTWGHCAMGPMARDVRDVGMLLEVIAGDDPRDPWSIGGKEAEYLGAVEDGVDGMRMAWSPDLGHVVPRDPGVIDAARDAVSILESLGALVDEPPEAAIGDISSRAYRFARQGWASHGEGPEMFRSTVAFRLLLEVPEKRALLCQYDQESGGHISPSLVMTYDEAVAVRKRLSEQLASMFSRYDVLVTPTFAGVAPLITDDLRWPFPARYWTAYTDVANFCGLPALSVMAGTVNGLPVGLQILGPPNAEATLLRVGRALETAVSWPTPVI
jgi:aspartyl-tRNA(Asn)/glutamyl-tRNA(Gln) amidotransferase subunit A